MWLGLGLREGKRTISLVATAGRRAFFIYRRALLRCHRRSCEHNSEQRRTPSDLDQSFMLKVICNQRDRFRARLWETEEDITKLNEKIGMLTTKLEKTKANNVKLYGKIRYVQNYNSEKVISRGSKKYAEDLESGFTSDVESTYKKIYEDDINPFATFSKKQGALVLNEKSIGQVPPVDAIPSRI